MKQEEYSSVEEFEKLSQELTDKELLVRLKEDLVRDNKELIRRIEACQTVLVAQAVKLEELTNRVSIIDNLGTLESQK